MAEHIAVRDAGSSSVKFAVYPARAGELSCECTPTGVTRAYRDKGLRRYGFRGFSYEYVIDARHTFRLMAEAR